MSLLRQNALSTVSRLSLASNPITPSAVLSRQFSGSEPFVIHANRPRITYDEAFTQSIKNPEDFWGKAAYAVTWNKKWDKVLDASDPVFPKWFPGAKLNTCYNCLDRHVEDGAGDQTALIYDCAYTGQVNSFTYKRLTDRVARLAGVLARKCGVRAGDRVVIYMPLVPQAIMAMLACSRLGAVHSVVFGGFAAKELATRVQHAKPKVIISCNCGIEPNRVIEYKPIVDEAIRLSSHKPQFVIMYNRPPAAPVVPKPNALVTELDYQTEVINARPHDPVPVDANDPVYLLYTSGTTGTPKAVVRPTGGHLVALSWTMPNIYGVHPRDVWWSASDIGWVVGHSYIVYAPLLTQCTTVLYEGKPVGTPNPSAFFRVLSQHRVNAAFYAPTALRAIRREQKGQGAGRSDPSRGFDLSALRSVHLAGEHCDVETLKWAKEMFKKPVNDHWWQTESGFAISSSFEGLKDTFATPPGSAGRPVPGYDVRILNAEGKEAAADELGSIVVKTPLPPGFMSGLWENSELYRKTYFKKFPGYYDTADSGVRNANGNLFILARTDDVINVAGHRISTSALEEALLEPQEVVEAAVVGLPDTLKGQIPFGFIVLRSDAAAESSAQHAEIIKRCVAHVRKTIGPVADLKKIIVVKKLPKTRSGKIARNTLAAKAAGQPYKIPITIEDADVYLEIADRLREVGITPGQPKA